MIGDQSINHIFYSLNKFLNDSSMISVMGFEKRDDIRINKNRGRYFNRCKTEKDAEIKCQNPYKLDIRHSNKFELKKKKNRF